MQTRQPLSQRREFTAQETFRHTPETQPVARPQDTYVDPAEAGSSLQQLAQALRTGGELMGSVGDFAEAYQEEQMQEGAEAHARGEELPEDSPEAKIQGFMRSKGAADSLDFSIEAYDYVRKNWHLDPEEFREGLNSITDEYIEGQSDDYRQGFIPQAREHEGRVLHQYMEQQHDYMVQEGVNNSVKMFQAYIPEALEQAETQEDFNNLMRNRLSEIQGGMKKEVGIPRDAISQAVMRSVGREAERRGAPELLGFFDIKDDDSISLSMRYPTEERTWRERAVASKNRELEQREIRREKQIQEHMEQAERSIRTQVEEISHALTQGVDSEGNPYSFVDAEQQLLDVKSEILSKYGSPFEDGLAFDPGTLDNILRNVNDLLEYDGFGITSDSEVKRDLIDEITGIQSYQDWERFRIELSDNRSRLTDTDYISIFQQGASRWTNMSDREVASASTYFNNALSDTGKTLQTGGDGLLSLIDPEESIKDARRVALFNREARHKFRQKDLEYSGKVPMDEVDKIIEKASEKALKAFSMDSLNLFGEGSPEGTDDMDDDFMRELDEIEQMFD